jgi:hypothetical protein
MTRTNYFVFADHELVELLIDEPQLLAIADALSVTGRAGSGSKGEPDRRPSVGRRRGRLVGVAAGVASLAAALLLLLFMPPWSTGPNVVQEALAAVGTQPVLHVAVIQIDAAAGTLVDLDTGNAIPRTLKTEIWFDAQRHLKRTVFVLDGQVLDEQLETAQGGVTGTGPIYTCAWIAGHPAEAEKAGVSCGTGSGAVTGGPAEQPSLDPTLAEFADQYRSALASGRAVEGGHGEVDGREVIWLEFKTGTAIGRVAVDASSYQPVAVESKDRATRFQVVTAETLPYQQGLFEKPEPARWQTGGGIATETEVGVQDAATTLGGTMLWLGQEWNGLKLVAITLQERRVSFAGGSVPEQVQVVRLTYAPAVVEETSRARSRVEIYQTRTCLVRVGWTCGPRDPTATGTVGFPVGRGGPALVRRNGLFISIWGSAELHERALEIARALEPVAG